MRKQLCILIACAFLPLVLQSQIFEDFSDGELLSSPLWKGDIEDFIVNDEFELQLMAAEAGESFIYTEANIGKQQVWEIYLKMDFAPSGSNQTRIYLALDSENLSEASGYFIQIGATGSEDALELYALNNGSSSLITPGAPGTVADAPAEARIKVEYLETNRWSVSADFLGGENLVLDINQSEEFNHQGLNLFGIYCDYTATRTDKFFFDDIKVPDNSAPELLAYEIIDPSTVSLCFTEQLAGLSLDQVDIMPALSIAQLEWDMNTADKAVVRFSEPLESGTSYSLDIQGLQDLNGNIQESSSITLIYFVEASAKSLVVNEILFDPFLNAEDFVEIYNRTEDVISLEKVYIANLAKAEYAEITFPDVIRPGEYLAFSSDLSGLENNYTILNPDALVGQGIPSFNNSDGNVSILLEQDGAFMTIDSFDYQESMHFQLLDDTEGVSLERVSPDGDSQSNSNWHSASSASGFATPGYENSVRINQMPLNNMFELNEKLFSPNGDSQGDLLIVNYSTDKPGFIVDMQIYDANGFLIRTLEQSLILSNEGFVLWDGVSDEGTRSPVGIYVLFISGFHADGTRVKEKLPFTLAGFLD